MGTLGNSAKVGLAVVIFVVLAGYLWTFFAGGLFHHPRRLDVLFNDVSGITPDAPVQLAGVEIGRVSEVHLTPGQKADLVLEIYDKVGGQPVVIHEGSQFQISTPLLGGTGAVTVVPPRNAALQPVIPDGATRPGRSGNDLQATLTEAQGLIKELRTTTRTANALLTSTQGGLKQTVANVNAASANGLRLTNQLNRTVAQDNAQLVALVKQDNDEALRLLRQDNAQVQGLLAQTRVGSQAALNNVVATTGEIRGTTAENRAQIREIVANLRDTTAAVQGITQQTNELLSSGGITKNLSATVANLKTTTDKLDAMAGNLQSLTGDPKVQANLRDTLQNVRDSSEEARLLLARLNKLAGTKRPAAVVVGPGGTVVVPPTVPPARTPRATDTVPLLLPRVQSVLNTRASHLRTDVDAFVPLGGTTGTFARAGLYGVGESTRLNLQYGQTAGRGSALDYRYGLYASRLSVGADYGLSGPAGVSLEFYDPNTPRLDAYGRIRLAPELGLVVGGENLTRDAGAVVGIEYRRSK